MRHDDSLGVNIVTTDSKNQLTTLAVTPMWHDPVKLPEPEKVRLPNSYNKNSPVDVRTYQCLSMYRWMKNKDQIIDFIAKPFVATIDNTETLVVVLNELATKLGARLSFTEKSFQYDQSDYRTACGVGNLGSIHSILGGGRSIQTARFKLHFTVDYADLVSTTETLTNFTTALIGDIASILTCDKEHIRVFSISRASSSYCDLGITTPKFERTLQLAEQLKRELNSLSTQQRQNILKYLIKEKYDYRWETVLSCLELQESDLDPRYNRDYPDAEEEMRGGRPYFFPQGWYRHALNMQNKYPGDQVWLGMNNSPGEWCVAYHGTKAGVVKNIIQGGLQQKFVVADVCKADAHAQRPSIPDVPGLYVATHCEGGASLYTEQFQVKDSSGAMKTYEIAFQCRVENDKFTEHSTPVNVGLALRVFDEQAIRPYGLLLKEVSSEFSTTSIESESNKSGVCVTRITTTGPVQV